MKKIITLLTISSLLFTSSFIYADNKDELNDQLIENQEEQQEIDKKIEEIDKKIEEIELNIQKTNSEIGGLNLEVEKTQSEIKELDEYIKRNEELLGKRLKIINSNYSIGYLKVILSSTSLSDFFNNIYMVRQVVEQDKDLLKELDDNKALEV